MAHWVRFLAEGTARFGTLAESEITEYHGDMFAAPLPTGRRWTQAETTTLPPVRPGKVIGLWNNFHALAAKLGAAAPTTPLYFLKAPSSLLADGGIVRPPAGYTGRVVYEGELGLVIGTRCAGADLAAAEAAIFGVTCVNDITALSLLEADPAFPQWARAKGCDGFGPCGPAIATGLDWSRLHIRTTLDGRERQSYPASDMILPPATIVSLLSREMTLEPGDLIACGTSLGVLPMRPGMTVCVTIDGIGSLTNRFEAALPG